MHVSVRSYLTAGVAMAGATALVVAPISASPPDIQIPAVSSVEISLAATVDPITAWLNVFEDTFTNVMGIGTAVASDPAPALRQLIINWLGYSETVVTGLTGAGESFITWATQNVPASLQAVLTNLTQGNVTEAAQEVNNLITSVLLVAFPLFSALEIPSLIFDSLARVVTTVTSLEVMLPLVSGVLSPVMSAVSMLGAQGQAFVDAIDTGDLLGALNAILNIPAAVVGGFLNGDPDNYPGLLTFLPYAPSAGLFGALFVAIPKAIAEALAPPGAARFAAQTTEDPAVGIADLPDVTAATITLDTGALAETPPTEVIPVSAGTEETGSEEVGSDEAATEETAETVTATPEITTEAEPETAATEDTEAPDAGTTVGGETDSATDTDTSTTKEPATKAPTKKATDNSVRSAAKDRSETAKARDSVRNSLRGNKSTASSSDRTSSDRSTSASSSTSDSGSSDGGSSDSGSSD